MIGNRQVHRNVVFLVPFAQNIQEGEVLKVGIDFQQTLADIQIRLSKIGIHSEVFFRGMTVRPSMHRCSWGC